VEVVVDRLAGDEVVVVQSDALCMRAFRRTQIAIVTIVSDDCACRVEQAVVESAVFVVPSEQGEEHIVIINAPLLFSRRSAGVDTLVAGRQGLLTFSKLLARVVRASATRCRFIVYALITRAMRQDGALVSILMRCTKSVFQTASTSDG
jgi:hypothetical protein